MIDVQSIPKMSKWAEDQGVLFLEKATDGRVTLSDIDSALDEYKRLYKAGISSPAELLTLSRAYPENGIYSKALVKMGIRDDDSLVVGGPASIELVDREGHLITTEALNKAFQKYMANFRTRNTMVLHSDVQVGWALPAYISKGGQIFKSGVDDKGLFFITELRNDTKISQKVAEQINEGKLKSYSIAGSALKTQTIQKGLQNVMQVDELELAEVTVCEKGVNQGASFDILKAEGSATSSCIDGSCLISKGESCNCGCDSQGVQLMFKSDGDIDFTNSFFSHMGMVQKLEPKETDSFPTLVNTQGRQEEHHRLLERYGFPAELEPENARYTPVTEYDPSIFAHRKPPWVVNEAGSNLGERYYEDALTTPQLGPLTQRGVAEGGNSGETPVTELNETKTFNTVLSSIKKTTDFFNWMEQEGNHIYKESCPCEFCFQKTSDYRGTVERGVGFLA
jgi:HK97 family phage prohead protease